MPEVRQSHGGDLPGLRAQLGLGHIELVDFSVNLNPLGAPPAVLDALRENGCDWSVYPELRGRGLRAAAAGRHGLEPAAIIPGAGAAELLYWLMAFVKPERVVGIEPAFADYRLAAEANGARFDAVTLRESAGFIIDWRELEVAAEDADMLILGHPNNPTGCLLDLDELVRFVDGRPETLIVIDEAFVDFAVGELGSVVPLTRSRANLVALRSMTKVYSIPNLRLGYLVGEPAVMESWTSARAPWPLSEVQERVAAAALADEVWLEETRQITARLREALAGRFANVSWLGPVDSQANFVLVKLLTDRLNDLGLLDSLARHGLIVRACRSFAALSDRYFRVAVMNEVSNRKLVAALERVAVEAGIDSSGRIYAGT